MIQNIKPATLILRLLVTAFILCGHIDFVQASQTIQPHEYGKEVTTQSEIDINDVINEPISGEILAPKTLPLNNREPSCEELRAMWRFSKRQSRAAEMTNEIPKYRDPFAYNIWESYYPTSRSIGTILPRYRDASRPVYGRIIHREPLIRLAERTRQYEDMPRVYGGESKIIEPRRRFIQFRFSGGGAGNTANALTSHHGSFQKLKEIIWTERAKELAQQRKAEETAARAAVLKEIADGQSLISRQAAYSNQQSDNNFAKGNPSSLNRNGGLGISSVPTQNSRGKSFYSKPSSHFRERNRSLVRQSGNQNDYLDRKQRDDNKKYSNNENLMQDFLQYDEPEDFDNLFY